MLTLPDTINLPMHTDKYGTIRVSGTRVTLDTIITCYHQGDTPEAIHEGFPTVPLTDIYTVIAYYIANRDVLDDYLLAREAEGDRLRREIEANYTPEQKARTEHFKRLSQEKRNKNNL